MKCAICHHGATQPGTTTVVLEKGGTILVYKWVPAEICDNCGETYLSAETNHALLQHAKQAIQRGVSLELLDFSRFYSPSGNEKKISRVSSLA